jgi:heptosyltransferase I
LRSLPTDLNVLIVKLSSLGDVVHTMPAVQDLRRALPGVNVDWVVEKSFAPLVQRCEGVRRVIPCELRRWRRSPFSAQTRAEWSAFRADLQAQAYDAIIDLQGLTKSALIAWLARKTAGGLRYALANQTDGSGYEVPTRWVADRAIAIEPHIHAVRRSRELCARALGYEVDGPEVYGLRPLQGGSLSENVALGALTARPCVALVHGTSRADKEWPQASWLELGARLDAAGLDVALLHGTDAEQQRSEAIARALHNAHVWPRLRLDALVDAMAGCAGVIGVDSGLSHIAVALDLPHVQIYNFDTAWRTGPLGLPRQRCVHARPAPGVDAVWQAWLQVWGGGA